MEAGQAGLQKRMQQIDRKGQELDALNRRYEKAVADLPPGEDAGTWCNQHNSRSPIQHVRCQVLGAQVFMSIPNLSYNSLGPHRRLDIYIPAAIAYMKCRQLLLLTCPPCKAGRLEYHGSCGCSIRLS